MASKIYAQRIPNVYQWHWNTTKAGGLPIPVTHVLQMLEGMVGGRQLSATASRVDATDEIGCIACRTGDVVELLIYRHLATRDNGNPIQVQVVLDGKTLAGKQWTVTQGSLIDRDHSGFAHEQAADMQQARRELGEDASALAVAMRVMARHREKYEKMSQLHQLQKLPELSFDDTGSIRFNLVLSGHSVVHLQLRRESGDRELR
jgi:xylan 1,4-beta-xylosidase